MKHWSYKGFTIIEVFLALSLTSILVVMSARGFLRAKAASRADIFVQEASLIRGAILRYKEVYGSLPTLDCKLLNKKSDEPGSTFYAFLYPFNPERSGIKGFYWFIHLEADNSKNYLELKTDDATLQLSDLENSIISNKFRNYNVFDYDPEKKNGTGRYFFLKEVVEDTTSATTIDISINLGEESASEEGGS